MSEPTTTTDPVTDPTEPVTEPQGDPASTDEPLGDGGKKALQAERERAKELEKQLKDATTKLTEIEKQQMTDLERAQVEAQEARQAAEKATAEALRYRIAAKHSISDEDAELFLTGADEETLTKQAARLADRTPAVPASPKPDLTQGGNGTPPALNSNALEQALKNKLGI